MRATEAYQLEDLLEDARMAEEPQGGPTPTRRAAWAVESS